MYRSETIFKDVKVVLSFGLELFEHGLRLLGTACWVLSDNVLDVGFTDSDFRSQFDPVFAEEIGDVDKSQFAKVVLIASWSAAGPSNANYNFLRVFYRSRVVGDDRLWQYDVQDTDRLLRGFAFGDLWFTHEQCSADYVGVLVFHANRKW